MDPRDETRWRREKSCQCRRYSPVVQDSTDWVLRLRTDNNICNNFELLPQYIFPNTFTLNHPIAMTHWRRLVFTSSCPDRRAHMWGPLQCGAGPSLCLCVTEDTQQLWAKRTLTRMRTQTASWRFWESNSLASRFYQIWVGNYAVTWLLRPRF
jgi:hypothetical protein